MKSSKLFLKPLVILLCSFLVSSCSPTKDTGPSGNGSSLADCEYIYESVFTATLHGFVRSSPRTCTNCHSAQAVSHQFGLIDGSTSFANFLLMSNVPAGSGRALDAKNKLRNNALDPNHNSSGDPAYLAELDSFESSWNAVSAEYSDCVAGN